MPWLPRGNALYILLEFQDSFRQWTRASYNTSTAGNNDKSSKGNAECIRQSSMEGSGEVVGLLESLTPPCSLRFIGRSEVLKECRFRAVNGNKSFANFAVVTC